MVLSTKESGKLLKQLYKNSTTHYQQKLAVRNLTMALLMLDSCLRISEIVHLVVSDLFIQGNPVCTLHVVRSHRKKCHDRFIPLTKCVRQLIESMDEFWWMPDAEKPGNFAFYNRSALKHVTERQFQRIIKQSALEAFDYPITPNILRQV